MCDFDKPPRYRSYLLSFWEERGYGPDTPVVWRFSLKDPLTGERHGFADLGALMAALERETASNGSDEKEEAGTG
jgi:hypothetical protein